MTEKRDPLPFTVVSGIGVILNGVVPLPGVQAQAVVAGNFAVIQTFGDPWQLADRYHFAMWHRLQSVEAELKRESEERALLENTLPFALKGYTFAYREEEAKYGYGRDKFWDLVDPWGRVHRANVPTIKRDANDVQRGAGIDPSFPVVPLETPFATPPEEPTDDDLATMPGADGSGED